LVNCRLITVHGRPHHPLPTSVRSRGTRPLPWVSGPRSYGTPETFLPRSQAAFVAQLKGARRNESGSPDAGGVSAACRKQSGRTHRHRAKPAACGLCNECEPSELVVIIGQSQTRSAGTSQISKAVFEQDGPVRLPVEGVEPSQGGQSDSTTFIRTIPLGSGILEENGVNDPEDAGPGTLFHRLLQFLVKSTRWAIRRLVTW
jgi:hypothetical protein